MSTRTDEPVMNTAAVTSAAAAIIALVVAFWPGALTDSQSVAVMGVVAVMAPLILGAIARGKVTPNTAVAEHVIDGQVIAGPANDRIPDGLVIRQIDTLAGDE